MAQLKKTLCILIACFVLVALTIGHEGRHSHKCIHDELEAAYQEVDVDHEKDANGRMLASYNNIRIFFDTSNIDNLDATLVAYIKNYLLPPAQNYFQSALKVVPSTSNLKFPGYSSVCSRSIPLPSFYQNTGVAADVVIMVTAFRDTTSNYIAYASACLLDSTTSRPILGNLNYNLAYITATANDADIESDVVVTMHELTHAFGFSSGLYNRYINPATNARLTGTTANKTVNGQTVTVLQLAALTSRVRSYFNCPTATGAYIENEGGSGSAGSHFERRVFYNEYMTASAIQDTRVSQFALSLLEGTGWYQVDYTMAEAMTWGQNEGCGFLDTTCVNTATKLPRFDEFCTLGAVGCSWTGRGLSVCSSSASSSTVATSTNYWGNNTVTWDTFADNCPTLQMYSNKDCEDPSYQSSTTMPTKEYYGYGSKCFQGTLRVAPQSMSSSWGYCFKPKCVQNGGSYILQVTVGTTTVSCTAKSQVTVSGYGGYLQCPDPADFCGRIQSEGFCRRGCMGKGSCVSQTCQCADGWSGNDCSRSVYANATFYVDQCQTCDSDPWRTTCSGANCICNPTNATCGCHLGTMSTSDCCNAGVTTGSACATAKESPGSNSTMIIAIAAAVGGVVVIASVIIFIKRKAILSRIRGSRGSRHQPQQQYEIRSPNTATHNGSSWEVSPNQIHSGVGLRGHRYGDRV